MAKKSPSKSNINDKNQKSKSQTKPKKKMLIALAAVAALAIIIPAAIFLTLHLIDINNLTSEKIMTELQAKSSFVKDIINYTATTDPNEMMGDEDSYIYKSSWQSTIPAAQIEDFAGTVEVFSNTDLAEYRIWYLNLINEKRQEAFSPQKYGEELHNTMSANYGTTYRRGNVVIRISSAYSDNYVDEWTTILNKYIDRFIVKEDHSPTKEHIKELKQKAKQTIDETVENAIKDFDAELDDLASDYTSRLEQALASLSEDDLASAKEDLVYFKSIPYFKDQITNWQNKINEIETQIADQKAEIARQEAEAQQQKLAQKSRTFSAGTYTVGTDIESGTYDVIAVSGSGNFFIESSIFSHYVNEIMSPVADNFYTNRYNNATVSSGDTIEIKGTLTVTLEAKR